jgi:hypothetical protein
VVGLYGIWQRNHRNGLVIAISPFIGLFIAASLGQYPIATRLVLFTFPLVIWVYATAIAALSDLVRPTLSLRGHLKTGQRWSLQNRPTESGLGLGCFTPPPPVEASLFSCANSVDRI